MACTQEGVPYEKVTWDDNSDSVVVPEDAETSESHEDDKGKAELRKLVLKKKIVKVSSGSLLSEPVSPVPENAEEMLTEVNNDAAKIVDDKDEDSVVSIDPNLLDSIGESPRGILRMLKSPNTRNDDREHNNSSSGVVDDGMSASDIIRLNIGGTKFSTTLPTLRKFPGSMLGAMFSGRFAFPVVDSEGFFFIDRDGTNFRFILNFLRDGTVVLPDDPRQRKEILKEVKVL